MSSHRKGRKTKVKEKLSCFIKAGFNFGLVAFIDF